MDSSSNVYVSDGGNYRIQKFNSNGNWIIWWSTKGTYYWEFGDQHRIAVESANNVYVTDYGNNRILVFTGILGLVITI